MTEKIKPATGKGKGEPPKASTEVRPSFENDPLGYIEFTDTDGKRVRMGVTEYREKGL